MNVTARLEQAAAGGEILVGQRTAAAVRGAFELESRSRSRRRAGAPGVVYTTFHHPTTQANVVTSDYSDWATNCPEYKVTAVQVSPSNGPSEWQEEYRELTQRSRRIEAVPAK